MKSYRYNKDQCREAVCILAECDLLLSHEADEILALIDYSGKLKEK